MGAKPIAQERARDFLLKLKERRAETPIEISTCPTKMGEEAAENAGFPVQVLPMKTGEETTAEDTKTAVRLMAKLEIDLIVFVGGDGTAKDVFDAMQSCGEIPVLGVPSGVKMYSGIFAVNPSEAADVVLAFARNQAEIVDLEVVDADEAAIRCDSLVMTLYGIIRGPFLPTCIQGSKQVSSSDFDETYSQIALARFITEEMRTEATYLLGPGTTIKRIAELLGVEKTVLGVDIYKNGKVILDVNEKRILDEVTEWRNVWIVLSPIGHQGMLLGRGNQQISSKIIKRVGKQRLIIVATRSKLQSIEGNVLRVDTGNTEVDHMLGGYMKVFTDYGEWQLISVR